MVTDSTDGLSYTSVAINYLIPFILSTIGDTLADRNGKGYIYPQRGILRAIAKTSELSISSSSHHHTLVRGMREAMYVEDQ